MNIEDKKLFKEKVLDKVIISSSDCWEVINCKNKKGYGMFRLGKSPRLTHRLSYEYHYETIPENTFVLHKCDNTCCCNPNHLFLGLHKDNMLDMVSKNRQTRVFGEINHSSVLTETQVKLIFLSTASETLLASTYKVSRRTIGRIRNKQTWVNVTATLEEK